ncbi:unnamed protein product [Thlaspi arvense]|uniref:TF-B3 domain-containing protein n=1 Tax=Thlaspi arvense TaxID=13288 RepID=A0AAU9SE55_THLAR|nr:unnamed protein product [Thlaspi arvense]
MANKHFFKPLLPGFHSHLTIPVAFFSKYIEGTNDQKKTTAKLRSDASKITWEVKVEDGQRLTDGWKEFALAHDLRVGDILIFRQEKDMAFHVTLMGPSCCEIQYEPCVDDEINLGKIPKKKKVKKIPRKVTKSSSLDPSCFVSNVAPYTLRYDELYFPMSFVRANGLGTRCGKIVLMNEKGTSWTLALKKKKSGKMYIPRGWRSLCGANGLKAGDSFKLKLIQGGRTLALRLSTTESKEEEEEEEEEESSEGDEIESLSTERESDDESNLEEIQRKKKVKKNPEREKESSSLDPSCFVAKVSPATLRHDKLNLPRSFVRANGVDPRFGEIVLMNEHGTSWTLLLKQEQNGSTYIRRGWRSFCHANGLKAGGFYTFKLIQRGRTPILSLSSPESEPEEERSEGNEVESLSTEPESDEESNLEKIQRKKKVKKNLKSERESSSLDASCFVTNISRASLCYDTLYLPKKFSRENGLDTRCGAIVLMNENGRSWTLNLKIKRSCGTMYITRGWRSFCRDNGLKAGRFFTFKLIQREGTLVLRLSSTESEEKSNQDEKSVEKRRSMWKGSSSSYQNRFVTLTLTRSNLERSRLFLPIPFTRMHGINEETKMTLLGKNGVKWSTDLRSENSGNRIIMARGWKEFFKAHCVKIGESVMFKLIWEGETSCVLTFCSKTIPVAFFSKYMQGRNDQKTMAKLRSDASKMTWKVKVEDGRRLTDGWKEFALAHDLRVGDIVIFRQEKDMSFHVTPFGPSCCDIQYEQCLDDKNKLGKIPKTKKVKNNPRKETESSSLDPSCFVSNVLPSALSNDALYLPNNFVRANGLDARCGEIVLMNEKGKSWTLTLKQRQCGSTYIRRGWRRFCSANGLKAGDFFTFRLIKRGATLVLRLSTKGKEESDESDEVESLSTEPGSDEEGNLEEIQRKKVKKNPERETESSSLDPSCFVANVTPWNLQNDRVNLPSSFVRANGLDTKCGEIVLMNEKGKSWTLNLRRRNSSGIMYIRRGWRSFCSDNGLRAGSFFTFKLIQRGRTLVLRLTESEEEECSEADDIESLSTDSDSEEESNQNEKSVKKRKAPSSSSQSLFVTLTVSPSNLKMCRLFLPVHFTRMHGINGETKMTLLDKNGVKWPTDLRSEKSGDRLRLVRGWKETFKASSVKIGESAMFKLIWEGDTSCFLKFCSKTIPVAFFSKYIEGRYDQKKTTAKLRSDASKMTWEVKIEDGRRLTDGWKEFALAHDLRIGDIVIFRQEKGMSFHVTLFGPSCCEIQYEPCLDDENKLGKIPKKKKVKKNPRKETESSSCFASNVTPSSLRYDAMNLPSSFARANGLDTRRGEIVLMNKKGTSGSLALKQRKSGTTYIRGGWRSFCSANGLKAGDFFTLKLIGGGRTLALRLSTTKSEEEEEEEKENNLGELCTASLSNSQTFKKCAQEIQRKKKVKKNQEREIVSFSLDPSCFVAKVSPATLRYDKLDLPRSFVRENGVDARCREIVLMNRKGKSWTLSLRKSCGTMYMRGWRSFCHANGLEAGGFYTFKLIKRGATLVLRLSSTESEEEECLGADEIESLPTESDSKETSIQDEKNVKKRRISMWKASSSSPSQNRFVTLTLKPFNLIKSVLFLPIRFTRMHGINEETKMTLLNKNGVKWSTDLRYEKSGDRIRLVGGWKEFFKAKCVKVGESVMFKLIWEGDTSCFLKFCCKVKQET